MNLEAVQQLIRTFYDPNARPETIQEAQEELLNVQKSDVGWELGAKLLDQPNPQEQFMGTLTFSIKINDGRSDIPVQTRQVLLEKLQQAVQNNYAQFVVLKLFTTIIALYVREFQSWDTFVIDLHSILQFNISLELTFFEELMTTYSRGYTGAPKLRSTLSDMVPSVLEMISLGLDQAPIQALNAYFAWCLVFGSELEVLLPRVFSLLNSTDDELFEKVCEVLTELYGANARSWQKPQKNALIDQIVRCTDPFDWDRSVPLGRLALSVCTNDILTKDMTATRLLPYIMTLTNNTSIQEDELLTDVLMFWSEFAENIVGDGMSSDYNPVFIEVVQVYWRRIQINQNTSKEEWETLSVFRRDYCDFLELVYPLLGRELFAIFANNILGILAQGDPTRYNWSEIEASLCCLNGLALNIDTTGQEYEYIEKVFSSRLWTDLDQCPILKVRHTAVHIIGEYDAFFESEAGRHNLPTALTYLFSSLNTASLQLTASKSIQSLCSSCRHALVGEVFNFLQVYEPIRFKLDPLAHQRTVTAIGNVIEALPTDQQPEPLWRLIMMTENSEMQPHDMVQCVAAIGKSMQKEKDDYSPQDIAQAQEFWAKDPNGIRANLMQLINEAFSMKTDVFEELCKIFKAGLAEKVPNPFTFPADVTLEFLKARKQQNNLDDLPQILDLAGFLISTQAASKSLSADIVFEATQLVSTQALSHSLELLSIALEKAPQVFLQLPDLNDFIQLALDGISSSDRFVLQKSAKFWATLASEPACTELLRSVGLELMNRLALQISGEAERSEVPYFSDVLRKLISKHMKYASGLLNTAFITDPQSRNLKKRDEKTRSTFVSQLQLLRGNAQTKDVVNKFWMFCRGLPEY